MQDKTHVMIAKVLGWIIAIAFIVSGLYIWIMGFLGMEFHPLIIGYALLWLGAFIISLPLFISEFTNRFWPQSKVAMKLKKVANWYHNKFLIHFPHGPFN